VAEADSLRKNSRTYTEKTDSELDRKSRDIWWVEENGRSGEMKGQNMDRER